MSETIARTDEFIYMRNDAGQIVRKNGAPRNIAALGPFLALGGGLLLYALIQLFRGHRDPAVWGALILAGVLLGAGLTFLAALRRLPGLTIDEQSHELRWEANSGAQTAGFAKIRSLEQFYTPNPRRSGHGRIQLLLDIANQEPVYLGSLEGEAELVHQRAGEISQVIGQALGAPVGALRQVGGDREDPGA